MIVIRMRSCIRELESDNPVLIALLNPSLQWMVEVIFDCYSAASVQIDTIPQGSALLPLIRTDRVLYYSSC